MFALDSLAFRVRHSSPRRSELSAEQAQIDSLIAELSAVLVDLEARAKYAKIEGAAVSLLVHAKRVSDDIAGKLSSASPQTRAAFEPGFAALKGQLRTVALALAHLCRRDVPH